MTTQLKPVSCLHYFQSYHLVFFLSWCFVFIWNFAVLHKGKDSVHLSPLYSEHPEELQSRWPWEQATQPSKWRLMAATSWSERGHLHDVCHLTFTLKRTEAVLGEGPGAGATSAFAYFEAMSQTGLHFLCWVWWAEFGWTSWGGLGRTEIDHL